MLRNSAKYKPLGQKSRLSRHNAAKGDLYPSHDIGIDLFPYTTLSQLTEITAMGWSRRKAQRSNNILSC